LFAPLLYSPSKINKSKKKVRGGTKRERIEERGEGKGREEGGKRPKKEKSAYPYINRRKIRKE